MKNLDRIVEEALSREPEFKLDAHFKDQVIIEVRKRERAKKRRLNALLLAITLVTTSFGIALIFIFKLDGLFRQLSGVVPIGIFIGVLVVIVQFLDRKLIKEQMHRRLT